MEVPITVLCDVRTAWEDAPSVFGPQKGADARTLRRLEKRLDELAARAPMFDESPADQMMSSAGRQGPFKALLADLVNGNSDAEIEL